MAELDHEAHRPFRVAGGPLVPILGIVSCLYLMLSLPVITWVRFLVWLDIGIFIYWFYGRTHSPLVNSAETAARSSVENGGNFVTMLGALIMFNAFFITILGFMTVLGITSETSAKWHELDVLLQGIGLGVTPESADRLGLTMLGIGIVVFAIGRLIARTGAKPATV